MKIKKLDDKPMIIHTKPKTKFHSNESQNATIKNHITCTLNRSPKIKETTLFKKPVKARNTIQKYKIQKENKTYRKTTSHGGDPVRERDISKSRKNIRNVKESNQSIKVKKTNLHIAGRTGAIGAKAATDQMEGGREVQQAAYIAHETIRPVTRTASRGARILKKQVMEQKKRMIKKVEAGKKLEKKSVNRATKYTVKGTTKKATKETAKTASKIAAKTATTATTTAAGSVGGPAGIAIGVAAGYASGVAVEAKDTKVANRSRKLAFFLDKRRVAGK